MGIDCRYCHTSVEQSSFANIPPTKTCMNCHSQIYSNAPILEPVRASFQSGESLEWTRVHDLPDFVYFNHSHPHQEGHRLRDLPRPHRPDAGHPAAKSLQMEWCLDCHRAPEKYVRPARGRVRDGLRAGWR